MNKVTKSSTKAPKRRRPNKKLVTTLDALADALPDEDDAPTSATTEEKPTDQVNIIKRKSMKSRPGAMKRRERLDKGERDRFAKNMAQMAVTQSTGPAARTTDTKPTSSSFSERMAALRGFISQTLEQKPESKAVKG